MTDFPPPKAGSAGDGHIELEKAYDPKAVEPRWARYWVESACFTPGAPDADRPAFSMVIPPPNVTGSLHMGHALNNTLQDILARYHRMRGASVLWVPGTDHAGIATQNVVEREVAREGRSRDDLGREAFVQRVWEWKAKYGDVIVNQLKRLGASCDWGRLRFTLDEGLSAAVREVFVRLYEEGLIYRGEYMINWCPRCRTALSDLEAEQVPTRGKLWYIRYPASDGSGGAVVVATTRPETLLGDMAVAVHPEDERYAGRVGAKFRVPFVERDVPLLADAGVSREFGTGAVKITPGHDFKDFELGRAHGLAVIRVMDENGRMTAEAGPYAGLDRFECRERIVRDLQARGLLEKEEPYEVLLGHCYRCRSVVEPRVSLQWFVRMKPLAEPAIRAVKEGRTRFHPSHWEATYFDWLENVRDWCISRQLWWGHRIPVWYCGRQSGVGSRESAVGSRQSCPPIVARETPSRCPTCGSEALEQDPDVLDTWFSSALWPFSTLGWPVQTEDLRRFYPTSVLVTGFDIIFFWVARMMMMGLKFMDDVPFRDVYIHALVRDAEGKKMSKSKGNVIDPLDTMGEFGTDALRFTLAAMVMMGRDLRLSSERIEGYKHFINKLWNAARLVLRSAPVEADPPRAGDPDLGFFDRWILSRLEAAGGEVAAALDDYRFSDGALALYQFAWSDFCDWYLELAKLQLRGGGAGAKATAGVMRHVLGALLKLLHPYVPFVTEELWQRGRFSGRPVSQERLPEPAPAFRDPALEAQMAVLQDVVTEVRHARSVIGVPNATVVRLALVPAKPEVGKLVEEHRDVISHLARAEWADGQLDGQGAKSFVFSHGQIHLLWSEARGRELEELDKRRGDVVRQLSAVRMRLEARDFVEKAPAEVVERARRREEELVRLAREIDERLAQLR